ncbi:MAG: SDR family NAD(P)-dependent oxidoreductase [Lachnospiraceae bacterium]|nr:SDR family NAD(P)-dependent oxidoreductase [Lachnospiraceae bacterium]
MKTVVITGSARGFGLCQAKKFKELGCNIVLSDVNEENLKKAASELESIGPEETKVIWTRCDVTDCSALQALWDLAKSTFGTVDIWINNAGVNSPDKPICELTEKEISFLLDIDLKGAIYGSKIAFAGMKEQGFGQIYNVEGYGSNDAMMTGLTLYGTAKRAVTYFTRSLAKESHDVADDKILVCRLTPGIMITDFIKTANGGATQIELPEKTKKIYNILGDYPETIVKYCVPRMLANTKNDARIMWLTNRRAFGRFLTAGFKKRDFFA